MVDQAPKRIPKILSTWWNRGPAGRVEEWETRVSEDEISRRQNRWRSAPTTKTEPPKPSNRQS